MNRRAISVFLAAEGLLCAAFLLLDLFRVTGPGLWLKYTAILLCLLFSLISARRGGEILTFLALAFTAAADVFLLITDRWYGVGLLLFLCAQSAYLIRLRLAGSPPAWPLRAGLPLLLAALLFRLGLASPLNLLACLYFSQLLVNALLAWAAPRQRRFALGLTLLLCCDLCVAAYNTLPPGAGLYAFARVGMWLFYLPSQVLISLSALPKKGNAT